MRSEAITEHQFLGSVIGGGNCCSQFLEQKGKNTKLLNKLVNHSKICYENVYKVFANAVQHNLAFIGRTASEYQKIKE